MTKKHALGKGLAALLRETQEDLPRVAFSENDKNNKESNSIQEIFLDKIYPNKDQPRKTIHENSLQELALSIKEYGVLQPIIVQKKDDNRYEIIAGERRWRASQIAGQKTIPIIEHKMNTIDQMKISLVENIQRVQLSPLEEAMAYENLIELYNFTQGVLAETLGKSRSYIANIIRLNKLSPVIKKALNEKKISYGHARCLIGFENSKSEVCLGKILENRLSVRETEKLFKQPIKKEKKAPTNRYEKNEDIKALENILSEKWNATVDILLNGEDKKIVIHLKDFNHFDSILSKIL